MESNWSEAFSALNSQTSQLTTTFNRWFGLILLPIVSFAADGFISIVFFIKSIIHYLRGSPPPVVTLAKARAIDLSIQFALFWMPFLVLLGWWTDKPLTLLFGA